MSAPANRWKLGLFVVSGCVALAVGTTWLGVRNFQRAHYTAYAYFDEALTGLEEGSPVRFRGVTLGTVNKIRVAPDKKHLMVEAALYHDYLADLGLDITQLEEDSPLPENLRAQVVKSWVTGTAFVQVDYFPDPPAGRQLLPFPVRANTLRTVPSTAKSLEDASREVFRELPAMAVAARELVDVLRADIDAARLPELARRLENVLALVEGELQQLRQQDTVASATRALTTIAEAADEYKEGRGPLAAALTEVQAAAASLRRELDGLELPATASSVRAAGDAVTEAGEGVRREMRQLRRTLDAIERLAALLERDPSALLYGRGAGVRSPLEER